jgi:ankyrin repeat protein
MNKCTKITHVAISLLLLFSFQISFSAAPDNADAASPDQLLSDNIRYCDSVEIKQLLLMGADPNTTASHPRTPLERLVMCHQDFLNHPDPRLVIHELVAFGANPDVSDDSFNKTPLHRCAFGSSPFHELAVEALLSNGANPFLKDYEGKTPRETISRRKRRLKTYALLKRGEERWREHIRMQLHGTSRPAFRRVAIAKRPSAQATNLLEKPLPKCNGKLEDE